MKWILRLQNEVIPEADVLPQIKVISQRRNKSVDKKQKWYH